MASPGDGSSSFLTRSRPLVWGGVIVSAALAASTHPVAGVVGAGLLVGLAYQALSELDVLVAREHEAASRSATLALRASKSAGRVQQLEGELDDARGAVGAAVAARRRRIAEAGERLRAMIWVGGGEAAWGNLADLTVDAAAVVCPDARALDLARGMPVGLRIDLDGCQVIATSAEVTQRKEGPEGTEYQVRLTRPLNLDQLPSGLSRALSLRSTTRVQVEQDPRLAAGLHDRHGAALAQGKVHDLSDVGVGLVLPDTDLADVARWGATLNIALTLPGIDVPVVLAVRVRSVRQQGADAHLGLAFEEARTSGFEVRHQAVLDYLAGQLLDPNEHAASA